MGDAGALLLGLLMSASTMVIGGRTPPASGVTYFFFAPLLIPFFILGRPAHRHVVRVRPANGLRAGVPHADKDHIHHRLLRLGHGHRRTVVILWLWTALLSGLVLFPLFDPGRTSSSPWASAGMAVALYTWFTPLAQRLRLPLARWPKWRFPGRCIVFAVSDGRSAAS